MRRQRVIGILLMTLGLLLATSATGWAKSKKKDKGLAEALEPITWGDTRKQVIEKLKQQKVDKLRENKKLRRDRVAMQRERRRIIQWAEKVDESYVRFDGGKSGYEVSLVSGHYTDNNGESMLRARDKVAQRFFFFIDGQLYKMMVAYHQDYLKGVGFEAFAAQTARKYGRPVSTEYAELYGEEELAQVTWRDNLSTLDIENQREFFGTFTMVFTDRQRLKKLQARNRAFGGSDKGDADAVSSEVASLTREEGGNRNVGVVDGIVGDVELDLNEGRPKGEQIRQPQPGEEVKSKPKKSKKSKKKRKPRKKKKVTKRDFSDLKDQGGDDELIIY